MEKGKAINLLQSFSLGEVYNYHHRIDRNSSDCLDLIQMDRLSELVVCLCTLVGNWISAMCIPSAIE